MNYICQMEKYITLSDDQSVSMSDNWYELAEPGHFWARWRFEAIKRLCAPFIKPETKILEIGCGNGLVMNQFEDGLGIVIDGCDLNKSAFQDMPAVSGKVFLYNIYDLNPELVGKYDMVVMLDVLEHIIDDLDFLQTAIKYLKKDGLIVVGVPAHQTLFSIYDKQVGHYRRYSGQKIRKLFEGADLDIIECKYWGFTLLPLTFLRKLILSRTEKSKVVQRGFKSPHKAFNWLMVQIMKFETYFFPKVISGTSIIAMGRKNK